MSTAKLHGQFTVTDRVPDKSLPILAVVIDGGRVEAESGEVFTAIQLAIPGFDGEIASVIVPFEVIPVDVCERGTELLVRFEIRACRVCGCTSTKACESGCSWVEPDLCSTCAPPLILAPSGIPAREL